MAGPENTHLTKNWLVKSSAKIMGPFTREEVMVLLTRRQITIIDEVRQPEGRWNYIRENRYFKEVVKTLRYEQDHSKEDTMTSTATVGSMSYTKTEPAITHEDFTLTPITPPMAPPQPQEKPVIKDVTPLSEETSASKASAAATASATKSYGTLSDQRVQNKIEKQNVLLRSILFVITAAAIVFVAFTYLQKERRSGMGYDQLLSAALRYKELGLYQRSLQSYKKAAALREPDLESQFQMSFLLINEDRQSLNGRRIIERALLKPGRTREEIIQAHLGLALSYMMDGDLRQAEDYLQKTLGYDAKNESAKINQAVIAIKKGSYAQAVQNLDELMKPESKSYPLILLYHSVALIELSKKSFNKAAIEKAISNIRAFTDKSHFLKKELSLLSVYMNRLSQNAEGEAFAVAKFMNEPLAMSRKYVRDLSLDWRNSEWDYLEKYCSEIYNNSQGATLMKSVQAVCLIESNRDMEAIKFLDESMAAAPRELATLQAQASYLWKLGRAKEAQLVFNNTEFKQTPIALYTQGEACLRAKDYACAEAAYKILSERDRSDVFARHGLAQVAQARKDIASLKSEIKAGFEVDPNYIPLIEMREQLESP